MPAIKTHDQHQLPLNADVAEWCPAPQALSALAVGTYQLDEATQQRMGRLHMYALQRDGAPAAAAVEQAACVPLSSQQLRLAELSSMELPGIFDLRWHPRSAMPQLAAALADGSVRVLEFGEALGSGGAAAVPKVKRLEPGEVPPEGMAVSLDYSRAAASAGEQLAVSFSSGQLQLFQVRAVDGVERGRLPGWQGGGLCCTWQHCCLLSTYPSDFIASPL